MDKKDLIEILDEGNPMNKWVKVAMSQIMAELQTCPCCKSEETERYSSIVDTWYRCAECGCRWRINQDKVKEIARKQVEEEKTRDPKEFIVGWDLSIGSDSCSL